MRTLLIISTLTLLNCHPKNSYPLIGHFEGYCQVNNKKLLLAIDFDYLNKEIAFISIPSNLQLKKPFTSVAYTYPFLQLKMNDPAGAVTIKAEYHKNNIDGNLCGSINGTIHLERVKDYVEPKRKYIIRALTLNNNGTRLPAKLFLPKNNRPSAAIIMVAGSGNHFKEEYDGAADMFASKGIATLTFDKRNVTQTANLHLRYVSSDITTMKDLVSDVEAGIVLLKTQKEIDPKKIGLIGFSLGAVEIPVVAVNHPDISFLIAVSGNATTDREFIINQAKNKYSENGYDEPVIRKAEVLYDELFDYAKTRENPHKLQLALDRAYKEKWGQLCFPKEVPNEDELRHLLTWNNFEFNPAEYWNKINIPCMVVYGEKDKYIPVQHSIKILDSVFSHKKNLLTLKLYTNADHTIRTIPDNKNFDFPKYADGYINDVVDWLMQQTNKR